MKPASIPLRNVSKRNAEVQCLLLKPIVYHDIGVQTKLQRERNEENDFYDNNEISPRYHRQIQLQPLERSQEFYEIRDVEPISLRTIQTKPTKNRREQKPTQYVKTRKSIIVYDDVEKEESDSDTERIIYARQPKQKIKKTYLPPNVRMICVREDAKRNF